MRLNVGRAGLHYPGGVYMPGGRDWQFRAPNVLELVLRLTPTKRARQVVYGHWPTQPRQPGTVG